MAPISPCWSDWASRPKLACSPPQGASTPIGARSSCWACYAPRRALSRVSTAAWNIRPSCAKHCAGTGAMCWRGAASARPRCRVASPRGATGCAARPQEAALAFPVLFETAVPALTSALARGLKPHQARLDTLFHIMAVLDDSNLAHRGGLAGLRYAQRRARQFLDGGGAAGPEGLSKAHVHCEPNSWRSACPPAVRQTCSRRPAGSRACAQAHELRVALLWPRHAAP